MSNIIRELFFGKIDPQLEIRPAVEDNKKNLEIIDRNEELLCSRLTGEDRELFVEYVRVSNKTYGAFEEESFVAGFRMGARFARDALAE